MNKKLYEIVSNTEHLEETKIKEVLTTQKAIKDYAYIIHDKDNKNGAPIAPHYHVAIRLKYGVKSDNVAKWFGIGSNFIQAVKGDWSDMLKYLTHENAPEKYQYSEDEVKSNYIWTADKVATPIAPKRDTEIINAIVNGDIREFNYYEHITAVEYNLYKKQIDNAFKYRTDLIKGKKRNMECVYITGKSGTGKSTYAQMMCESKGYSYFVSSGSNDVLDGYAGQDCIILDDLRPSCMGLSDLLKMLDNNTASTVKSRYKNKVLECKMIIITSILKIDEFFNGVFKEQKEPITQLKRRCKMHLRFENDYFYASVFDPVANDYSNEYKYENPVSALYPKVELTQEEQLDYISDMLIANTSPIAKGHTVPGLVEQIFEPFELTPDTNLKN